MEIFSSFNVFLIFWVTSVKIESECKVNLSKSYAFCIGSSKGKNLKLFCLELYLGRLHY